jgi:hypothetical protein
MTKRYAALADDTYVNPVLAVLSNGDARLFDDENEVPAGALFWVRIFGLVTQGNTVEAEIGIDA